MAALFLSFFFSEVITPSARCLQAAAANTGSLAA